MWRNDGAGRMRIYQVEIKEEYLEDLFWYDAGSVEQEIFAKAEHGVICVATDRPHMIFARLGEAVKSVMYMGPLVDLPLEEGVFEIRQGAQDSRLRSKRLNLAANKRHISIRSPGNG